MSTIRILVIGQSNAVGFGTPTSAYAVALNNNCQLWNWNNELVIPISDPVNIGLPWPDVAPASGSLCVTLANTVQGGGEDTVIIIPSPKGATSLAVNPYDWAATDADSVFQLSVNRAISAGGCDYIVWYQGENDANANVDPYTYLVALNNLATRYRVAFSNTSLPFIAIPIGYGTQTDGYGSVRKAISLFDDGIKNFCTPPVAALSDPNLHVNTYVLKIVGEWCGNVINYIRGLSTYYRGPKYKSSTLSTNKKTITINCTLSSGTLLLNNGIISKECFRVFNDNNSQNITSVILQNNTIIINVENELTGTIIVDYLYTHDLLGTNIIYGNDSLFLPLDTFSEEVLVSNFIGTWDSDNCLLCLSPNAWSKGNGTTAAYTGQFPSYPLSAGQNITYTAFTSAYGFVPNNRNGYIRCNTANKNYFTMNLPYTFKQSTNETVEAKIDYVGNGATQVIMGAVISTRYWYAAVLGSNKLRFIFVNGAVFNYIDTTSTISNGIHTLQFRKKLNSELSIVVDGVPITAYDTNTPFGTTDFAITTQNEIGRINSVTPAGHIGSNIYWVAFYNKYLSNETCLINHNLGNDMGMYGNNINNCMYLSVLNIKSITSNIMPGESFTISGSNFKPNSTSTDPIVTIIDNLNSSYNVSPITILNTSYIGFVPSYINKGAANITITNVDNKTYSANTQIVTNIYHGTINPIYADTYKKPYYQTIVPFTDCYNKNGGRVDHVLSAQNFIPEEPIRGLIITSAGNLTMKLIDGSILTKKWSTETIIDDVIISCIFSASVNLSASQAKGIYPLW